MKGIGIQAIAPQLGHDVRQSARYAHFSDAFLQGTLRSLDGVFKPVSPWAISFQRVRSTWTTVCSPPRSHRT